MGQAKVNYGKWAEKEPVFTRDDITRMLQTTTFNDPKSLKVIYLPNKKFFEVFGHKEKQTIMWDTPNIGTIEVNFRPLNPKDL